MSIKTKLDLDIFKKDLVIRDDLAVHRTVLSNERSLMAQTSAFFTAFIAGVSLIRLFDSGFLHLVGFIFMIIGFLILIDGMKKYFQMKKLINKESDDIRAIADQESI